MKSNEQEGRSSWWQEMLTRREANSRIAKLGITAVLIASAGITAGCGDDGDDGLDVDREALDLQQQEGWNVGSTSTNLAYKDTSATDSQGSMNWTTYKEPAALLKAYQPANANWQPYVVPTLLQSLAQTSLRGQVQPVHSRAMDEAYSRGLGMREILSKSKNASTTMIVVDLPGPEAVAYAAALADIADPIMTFDNWPHPLGVVQSHQTLGAALYYAGEVSEKAAKRPADAPAVLIMDSSRLTPYTDGDKQFDNRYMAKLPTADKLSALSISNVLYAVPDQSQTAELDDINEDFAIYKEKGINVSMVALSDFKPDPNAPAATDSASLAAGSNAAGTVQHTTYHYGGGAMFAPWFFYHYPLFIPMGGLASRSRLPATSLRGSTYNPVRRPTMFSARTVGGASGIGRQRPSGFGKVSTRVGSNGRSTVSSGRSGSFGRSRSGSSS